MIIFVGENAKSFTKITNFTHYELFSLQFIGRQEAGDEYFGLRAGALYHLPYVYEPHGPLLGRGLQRNLRIPRC